MQFGSIQVRGHYVVRENDTQWDYAHVRDIDGASVRHVSTPLLLLIGVPLCLYGALSFYGASPGPSGDSLSPSVATGLLAGVAGVVAIVAYLATRRTLLIVYAGGLRIEEVVTAASMMHAKQFCMALASLNEATRTGSATGYAAPASVY